jgi:hypothetical protein
MPGLLRDRRRQLQGWAKGNLQQSAPQQESSAATGSRSGSRLRHAVQLGDLKPLSAPARDHESALVKTKTL